MNFVQEYSRSNEEIYGSAKNSKQMEDPMKYINELLQFSTETNIYQSTLDITNNQLYPNDYHQYTPRSDFEQYSSYSEEEMSDDDTVSYHSNGPSVGIHDLLGDDSSEWLHAKDGDKESTEEVNFPFSYQDNDEINGVGSSAYEEEHYPSHLPYGNYLDDSSYFYGEADEEQSEQHPTQHDHYAPSNRKLSLREVWQRYHLTNMYHL